MINFSKFLISFLAIGAVATTVFAVPSCCTVPAESKNMYCALLDKNVFSPMPGVNNITQDKAGRTIPKTQNGHYELNICDKDGWVVSYTAVIGLGGPQDRQKPLDGRVPNGIFKIIAKSDKMKGSSTKEHQYHRYLELDYKNPGSNAYAGIEIHGTPPYGDGLVQSGENWTDGCISVTNKDIESLYNILDNGTSVEIRALVK